ncbi:MAG TPA: hypothetical protein VGQ20_00720 [Acidimicrobiales bacterium]|nr:hypothetical protein [Acidimicrobiales bacterium]
MTGNVYTVPPQPPVPEHTRILAAGAITFGVEYRDLDPASLEATYAGNEAHLAELRETSPEGGFSDEGVSIHVSGTDDGHEYLRFDIFDDNPHYHYNHRVGEGEAVCNNIIDFDPVAQGDMLPWAIERLRTRLAPMLEEAGGGHLVPQLDAALIASVLDDVQAMADAARRARAS